MATPSSTTAEDSASYNRIAQISNLEGIPFYNFNYFIDAIGLDFESDMVDSSHINYWGSMKFVSFLGKIIDDNYSIPDRRGDPLHSSWNETQDLIDKWRAIRNSMW